MREIKFRGVGIGTSKWYYGDLRVISAKMAVENGVYIVPTDTLWHKIEVDPKSVGQYTGLRDKNGKEIYEGDIIELINWIGLIGIVSWDNKYSRFVIDAGYSGRGVFDFTNFEVDNGVVRSCKVIGNIYEKREAENEEVKDG